MDLKGILAIGGKPGLFKLVAQSRSGIIVEGLKDGKRMPVHASQQVSALEDIAIYTYEGEHPLKELFTAIYKKENGGETISPKSSGADMAKYFSEILPDYDTERVYTSDMKKVFQWYNLLLESGLMIVEEPKVEAKEEAKAAKPKAKKTVKSKEDKAE